MNGVVVWFTGLPRSGKSTLARAVAARRSARNLLSIILDGDEVRRAISPPPGYDARGRDDFYATLGRLAALLAHQGFVVLVPATTHLRRYRDAARALAPTFVEVHVATPVAECRARDPAGLYTSNAQAALPGVGVEYEVPRSPDAIASGGNDSSALDRVLARVETLMEPSGSRAARPSGSRSE